MVTTMKSINRILLFSILMFTAYSSYGKPTFHVRDYGAVGDGKTNDIVAFQRLVKDVNIARGGTVVFDAGRVYLIGVEDDPNGGHTANASAGATAFNFENCNCLTVDLNGATIKLAKCHSSKYTFFRFFNCSDFVLRNGTLTGDATTHNYSPVIWRGKREDSTHEWGMGVVINGSKGTVCDMKISHMTGDAIYSGNFKMGERVYSAKVLFKNLELSYCRKNGVGCLSSEGTTFDNCHIHHIGTYDGVKGTSPQSGIDFEYEDGTGGDGNIQLTNCHIKYCTKRALIAANGKTAPQPKRFVMKGCILDSECHLANMRVKHFASISDCKFSSTFFFGQMTVKNCSFELPADISYITGTSFVKCQFTGVLNGFDKDPHGCCFTGNGAEKTSFSKCVFRDIKGTCLDNVARQGFSGYAFPMDITFDRCEFYNVTFGRGKPDVKTSFFFNRCELSDGCSFYNNDDALPIVFKKCTLREVRAGTNKTGRFEYRGCKIYRGSETSSILSSGHGVLKRGKIIDIQ